MPTTKEQIRASLAAAPRTTGKVLKRSVESSSVGKQAVRTGVDGLVISNHGGRQLDAAPHPLHQLPHIRAIVGNKMPLIVDSGVRSGLDVAKAIASGADFVMLGRSFLYAVAALGASSTAPSKSQASYAALSFMRNTLWKAK